MPSIDVFIFPTDLFRVPTLPWGTAETEMSVKIKQNHENFTGRCDSDKKALYLSTRYDHTHLCLKRGGRATTTLHTPLGQPDGVALHYTSRIPGVVHRASLWDRPQRSHAKEVCAALKNKERSNKCAKNLCKRTVLVQYIVKNMVTCFWNTMYIFL